MTNNIRITAKKSLGQNFLVNEGVLDRIVETAELSQKDIVLEVGPGTGALTKRLAASGARVIAIEKDARLIAPLKELFSSSPNVTIIEGDALTMQPADLGLAAGKWKLIANIPYYLTGHLIRFMLEEWPSPSRAVLMVQLEVAERMCATPPDMNLLALSVQLYATPNRIMRVSRGSFRPIPDVDSAVIRIEIPAHSNSAVSPEREVLAIARRAFAQKRKKLTATIPEAVLVQAGVNPSQRPQELSVDQWKNIGVASR